MKNQADQYNCLSKPIALIPLFSFIIKLSLAPFFALEINMTTPANTMTTPTSIDNTAMIASSVGIGEAVNGGAFTVPWMTLGS